MKINIREATLAEEIVNTIDYMGRMLGAVEEGSWGYIRDKAVQLRDSLDRLIPMLNATSASEASGTAVAAYLIEHGRHYWIGQALADRQAAPAEQRPARDQVSPEVLWDVITLIHEALDIPKAATTGGDSIRQQILTTRIMHVMALLSAVQDMSEPLVVLSIRHARRQLAQHPAEGYVTDAELTAALALGIPYMEAVRPPAPSEPADPQEDQ